MSHLRKIKLVVLLFAISSFVIVLFGFNDSYSYENEIPVYGAVYHVCRSNGSHKTYLDIVVGRSFPGELPDDIDSITVTGPDGELSIEKDNFKYNPQWRSFWTVQQGFPKIGKYTFKVVSGNFTGLATDNHVINRTIPLPDVYRLKPSVFDNDSCVTPTFSWPIINETYALYYQLQIRDSNRKQYIKRNI